MIKKIVFLLLLIAHTVWAQEEDVLVFFIDKEQVEERLANPISILSQRALDRKDLHGTPIDARDVPVNEAYIAQLKEIVGASVLSKSKWLNCAYVQATDKALDEIQTFNFVASIEYLAKELNTTFSHTTFQEKFESRDKNANENFDYGTAANQIVMLQGDHLHEQGFAGENMIVAMMDSGFPNINNISAFDHVFDTKRVLGTYDFALRQEDVTGTGQHGTQTWSDIAGKLDGTFVGTAPQASFYLFRTEFAPTETPVEEAWWVEALERADSLGVDVVNTSLGYQAYDDPRYDHSYEDLDGQTTLAARGANIAFAKGMILVTSAGNSGSGFGTVGTPADAPGVLTVGAVDANKDYVSFSSRGPTVDGRIKPDVMAQGLATAVLDASGTVGTSNGTSFSSPVMAGLVACLWQAKPEATNEEIINSIRQSSDRYANPDGVYGYGIPDFKQAYAALLQLSLDENTSSSTAITVYPNPVKDVMHVTFDAESTVINYTLYTILGTRIMVGSVLQEKPFIDVSDLRAGVYLVQLKGAKEGKTLKIIKQ